MVSRTFSLDDHVLYQKQKYSLVKKIQVFIQSDRRAIFLGNWAGFYVDSRPFAFVHCFIPRFRKCDCAKCAVCDGNHYGFGYDWNMAAAIARMAGDMGKLNHCRPPMDRLSLGADCSPSFSGRSRLPSGRALLH